ncbi:MAG: TonB-dependent receptor [Bacteroidia bacterium]|nr:TonB-dependent receptor [Bacteroidia bacterium]
MIFNKVKFSAAIFLLFLLPVSLMAQEVTISGTVKDKATKDVLTGATVMAPKQSRGTYVEDDGTFSLKVPLADTIQIRVTMLEFDTVFVDVVTVAGKSDYPLTIEMSSGEVEMETVVITAGRHEQKLSDVTISMEVINPKQVDVQATTDVTDVLQQSPGVDIIDGQPNIRGSSGFAYGVGSRVMVMLDGLPLLSADASFPLFDMIPTDNLSQIEIMKGASSVLYGSSALGGVINVITADAPREPMTSVRVRGAMFDAPPVKANDWDGNKSATQGSFHVFHTRRIKNQDFTAQLDLIKDTGYRYKTDKEQLRSFIMTKFRPEKVKGLVFGVNAAFRIDSSSTYLFWDSYLPDTTISAGDTTYSLGALSGEPSTRRSQLNWRVTVDPFLKYLTPKGRVHMYRSRILRSANTNNSAQSNFGTMWYNDYQFTTKILGGKASWVTGGTFIRNWARGDSLYGSTYVDPVTNDTTLVGGKFNSTNFAAYTQLDLKFGTRLNISAGARYDYWIVNGGTFGRNIEQSPVFRFGANYNVWAGGNVRGSIGQAFRSPSIAERYTSTNGGGLLVSPNPALKPEKGVSAEIGIRQGFRAGTKTKGVIGYLDFSAFVMQFNNMIEVGVNSIQPSPIPGGFPSPVFNFRNVTKARIPGMEITGLAQFTLNKFTFDITGGFTWVEPRNLNPIPDSLQADLVSASDDPQAYFNQLSRLLSPDGTPNKLYDQPSFLKYRNRFMTRMSVTVGYGKFNLTTNIQTKSQMLHIDQYLFVAIAGALDYVKTHPGGYTLVNTVLGYDVTKKFKASFHVNNLFNTEWVQLPGLIGEQRRFSIQLKYVF